MKITNPEKVQIGHWASSCCDCDLQQIVSTDFLYEVKSSFEDDYDFSKYDVWESEDEALAEIYSRDGFTNQFAPRPLSSE